LPASDVRVSHIHHAFSKPPLEPCLTAAARWLKDPDEGRSWPMIRAIAAILCVVLRGVLRGYLTSRQGRARLRPVGNLTGAKRPTAVAFGKTNNLDGRAIPSYGALRKSFGDAR
jgi:hypothetical protein